MSIAGTLSSALSGLQAASRAADVVASNIANATTPGYARRELQLVTRVVGGATQGVEVTGVVRIADAALMSDRRVAEAASAGESARAAFLERVETALGQPGDDASLAGRVATLESTLIAAASRPDSEARLADVLNASKALVERIGSAAALVQQSREGADRTIAEQVDSLNRTLAQVAEMNARIRTEIGAGRDASGLMDERQRLVDRIAGIVPVREQARPMGMIALTTPQGTTLLDDLPAVFGFEPAGVIVADMTVEGGSLSGLTLNGRPVASLGAGSAVAGGTLAAHFEIRDRLAPEAQAKLDALARDLVERFADPGLDPTLAPGEAGLFTDAGGLVDPMLEDGLAQRLTVNAAVDPARGGALWRLRDGIGATTPGPAGESALLTALQAVLTERRTPASGGFMPGGRSVATLASDVLTTISTARLAAESESTFAAAKSDALRKTELDMGVDTDAELQQLLVVEQAYAANARVIKTVDEMVNLLLEL
jgi:flagellar hook-associated protein 1 FlgK